MHSANWLLSLFFINNSLLIHQLCDASREKSKKKLDKKWEALREPLLRKRALELTQKQMLNVLGLNEFPRRNRRVFRPHTFMLDLYDTLSRGAKHWKAKQPILGMINTVRGVVDQEIYDRSVTQPYHQLYVFDLSTIPETDKVISAELRILRKPKAPSEEIVSDYGTVFKATIHMTKRMPFLTNQIHGGLEPLDSFSFDIADSAERWHVITVTKAVQRWQHPLRRLHYLHFTIQSVMNGKFVDPMKLGFGKEKRLYRNRALLVVFLNDGKAKLGLGATNSKETDSENSSKEEENWMEDKTEPLNTHSRVKRGARRKKYGCHVIPLPVDFEKLDWGSWVIAPRGYNAGICRGACSFPLEKRLRPTNHATVQTILNTVDPLAIPPVCCVPNKLSSLGILYTDPGGDIVYKQYENMVVERCGCS